MTEQLKLDNQLCFRLYSASRLVMQSYTPALSAHGLTYPQYLVLMVLWEKDGQPVNGIARRLYLETNTVTPLLKRMEAAGLVTRCRKKSGNAGTEDGRQVIVSLTPAGRALEKDLAGIPAQVGGAVLCESVTPDTVPGLFRMLDGIIGKLRPI